MKRFFFLLFALIIAGSVATIAYPMISPYHARLRADIADPAKRQVAIRQAIDFEKTHYRALLGDKAAQYKFGLALSSGELGFTDTTQAVSWFNRSAQQGYPLAQFAMAHYCFTGDGIRQDSSDGAGWAEKASESGKVPQSRELMGLLFAGGIGEQQDMMRGLDLLKTAQTSAALDLATNIDQELKGAYALPKEQRDQALLELAKNVQQDVRTKFPAMEKNLAKAALIAPPSEETPQK
jgi:TPR repeat protein